MNIDVPCVMISIANITRKYTRIVVIFDAVKSHEPQFRYQFEIWIHVLVTFETSGRYK